MNAIPLTPMARIFIIVNGAIWFFGQLILEQYFLKEPKITMWLALTPIAFLRDYFIWQPFTYLFVHDLSPLPVIFNLLLIWWLGSELERLWGSRFFAVYYIICGLVAGLFYAAFTLFYSISTGKTELMIYPLAGAQASIFGLMVAYGMIYGERLMYFMFLFPLKARYFVMILAGIEIIMVLNQGAGNQRWASLAHLAGFLAGFLMLKIVPFIRNWRGASVKKKKSKLKLVVNNDFNKDDKPKYWH